MTFLRRLRTFGALSPDERQTFFRAMVLLPVVAWRVKFDTLKSTITWLKSKTPTEIDPALAGSAALYQARHTTWLLFRALRYSPITGKCLSQSMVLWHLLRHQGIQSELRIGFNKGEDQLPFAADNFNAHAWVECQGVVLNDSPDVYERFIVFDEKMPLPD